MKTTSIQSPPAAPAIRVGNYPPFRSPVTAVRRLAMGSLTLLLPAVAAIRSGRSLLLAVPAILAALGVPACGDPAPGSRWAGKTYLLDIPPANWVQPQGIGGDIGEFVPQFLLGVAGGSGADLKITVGTGTGGAQDPCSPTTQVTAAGASYPDIRIGPTDARLRLVGMNASGETVAVNTTIHDLTLDNVLGGDAPARDGAFSVTVDAGEVYPLFRLIPNASPDSVCAALSGAGAPCRACAFNGLPYCLALRAVQLGAVQTSVSLQTIAVSDIPASCSP